MQDLFNSTTSLDPLNLRTNDLNNLKNKELYFDIGDIQGEKAQYTFKGVIKSLYLPINNQELPLILNIIDEHRKSMEIHVFEIKKIRTCKYFSNNTFK